MASEFVYNDHGGPGVGCDWLENCMQLEFEQNNRIEQFQIDDDNNDTSQSINLTIEWRHCFFMLRDRIALLCSIPIAESISHVVTTTRLHLLHT